MGAWAQGQEARDAGLAAAESRDTDNRLTHITALRIWLLYWAQNVAALLTGHNSDCTIII